MLLNCSHFKVLHKVCLNVGFVVPAVWDFLLKSCVSERAKLLLCPLEQNHYPSPDKVWGRTRMFPVYFIEFSLALPWEQKFCAWRVDVRGKWDRDDGPVGVCTSRRECEDTNRWSKIRSSPLVRVMADGGSKNEMMPAFFVQSSASSAPDGSLETKVGRMW